MEMYVCLEVHVNRVMEHISARADIAALQMAPVSFLLVLDNAAMRKWNLEKNVNISSVVLVNLRLHLRVHLLQNQHATHKIAYVMEIL
jgi:hypothetical protein